MWNRTRFRPVLVIILALMAFSAAGAGDKTYDAVRAARPDGRRVKVADFTIVRDAFRFSFAAGEFHFVAPVDGRTFAAVFIGQGSYELTPATEIERRHLVLLSRDNDLKTFTDTFDSLVLLFTDETVEEIRAHGAYAEGAPDEKAAKVFDSFLSEVQKKYKTNLFITVVQDHLQAPQGKGSLFLASVDGKRLPPALAVVDRGSVRRLRVMPGLDTASAETALFAREAESPECLYVSHTAEEVRTGDAQSCRPMHLADALHYTIDTRISNKSDLSGTTTLRFKTLFPGLRVLPLDLDPRLRLSGAARLPDAAGEAERPLVIVQEDEKEDANAAIIFPDPLPRGTEVSIRLEYAGKGILTDAGDGNFVVGSRTSWYPNLGFGDWATFDLAYSVPEKNQVISVGELIKTSAEGGHSLSTWRAKTPVPVAGFNYGTFKLLEKKDEKTGVRVQVYTNPGTPDVISEINAALSASNGSLSPSDAVAAASMESGYLEGMTAGETSVGHVDTADMANSAMADGINSTRDYTARFGPQPQDRIAITQQSQWSFGQSWPSLIFLPYIAFLDGPTREALGDEKHATESFVDQVGLHEMSHQWWGHLVGWEGYRDQWLSEGFAEFSASLALTDIRGWAAADKVWEGRRKFILANSGTGSLRNCDAGPISLGARLATGRTPMAYNAVVYEKGAYVLHMLRMMMRDGKSQQPDERFFAMMQDYVKSYTGKNPSTADFKEVVERHMTRELDAKGTGKVDWFFDQWVDGIEIPSYTSSFEIEKADGGKWHIHGTVKQDHVSDSFLAMVPMYLEMGKGVFVQIGRAPFKGVMSHDVDVTLALPEKPKRVLINAHHDVLAMN